MKPKPTYQIDGELFEGMAAPHSEFLMANPGPVDVYLNLPGGIATKGAAMMAADPRMYDGLAHAFLDGGSTLRIESRVGWNTLGMEFRLVWSIGAAFTGYHAWYLDPGV